MVAVDRITLEDRPAGFKKLNASQTQRLVRLAESHVMKEPLSRLLHESVLGHVPLNDDVADCVLLHPCLYRCRPARHFSCADVRGESRTGRYEHGPAADLSPRAGWKRTREDGK